VAEIGVLDTVRIVTADGERHQFRVAAIKADAIIGNNNERVPIKEIHMIEVKRFDAAGTGLLVLGPPLVAAGLLVISIGTMSF
jgi:hypothetical protein